MYDWILDQVKTNQFLSGAIGGSLSFTILAYAKNWFMFAWSIFRSFFIREITISSHREVDYYNSFSSFVSRFIKNPKSIKITEQYVGKRVHMTHTVFGSDGTRTHKDITPKRPNRLNSIHQIGFGAHWFIYNWHTIVKIVVSQDSSNHTQDKTETISVYFMGISPRHNRNKFYEEFTSFHEYNTKKPSYYKMSDYGEEYKIREIKPRSIDSIFMDKVDLLTIDHAIESSFHEDVRFTKLGQNKNLGILLHGPPGTGKSSLIQALATKYNKNILYVDFSENNKNLTSVLKNLAKLKDCPFIVLEDIDCHKFLHKRTEENEKSSDLSLVLRMLDGVDLPEGSVVFVTTNNLKILDEALTRSGRFDIRVEMGAADKCMAKAMIEFIDVSKLYLLDTLTFPVSQSDLQAKILRS